MFPLTEDDLLLSHQINMGISNPILEMRESKPREITICPRSKNSIIKLRMKKKKVRGEGEGKSSLKILSHEQFERVNAF